MISGLEIDYEPPGLAVSSEEPDMRAVDVNDTLTLSQSELIRHKYIQLKEMSQDRAQWRRKISEWSSAVANPHRGRSTSE